MPVADKIERIVEASSMIRKMFEDGLELKKKLGEDKVFDFSLGNPDILPPPVVKETLLDLIENKKVSHGYMSSSGYFHVRQSIADYLNKEYNINLTPELIVITVGAAGALNNILRVLINPGEDVLVPSPYFIGYKHYTFIANAGLKTVQCCDDFHLDLIAIKNSIDKNTRIMLINSPNNPTGTVYHKKELQELGQILNKASQKFGKRIYLVSDEPYRKIAYNVEVPSMFDVYPHTIVLTSYSKELSLAGERIGYLAVHPDAEDAKKIADASGITNTMMYGNAPALFQQVIGSLQGVTVDIGIYRARRDLFCENLKAAGYKFNIPEGAFYLFPKSPIANDIEFIKILKKQNILAVHGTSFGAPGYFRLSYAVSEQTIKGSIEGFKRAFASKL